MRRREIKWRNKRIGVGIVGVAAAARLGVAYGGVMAANGSAWRRRKRGASSAMKWLLK